MSAEFALGAMAQFNAQADALREAERRIRAPEPTSASLSDRGKGRGCPCRYTTPCQEDCTCVKPFMSHGCFRCATYGSFSQRKAKAEQLAAIIDAAYADASSATGEKGNQ